MASEKSLSSIFRLKIGVLSIDKIVSIFSSKESSEKFLEKFFRKIFRN